MFFARSKKEARTEPKQALAFVQYYTEEGAGRDATKLTRLTWEFEDRPYTSIVLPNIKSHKFAVVGIDMIRKLEHIVPVWQHSTSEKELFYVNRFASFH